MSAAKRRIKRKIAQLVRMDDTRSRMFSSTLVSVMTGKPIPAQVFWDTCMTPLGRKITAMGGMQAALLALDVRRQARIATGGRA